jgi:adenylosuccinate lyase
MSCESFDNPLAERYASAEMVRLWSPQSRYATWRKLWVALAEAEAELGLAITPQQLAELRSHVEDIDFDAVARYERRLRHDVMAHIHAYGDLCPAARPIIHLGATSCYVTDNADLLLMRAGLELLARRLAAVVDRLATFALQHRAVACLGFTHLQPAQPTTVGKRACLWAYDLVLDLQEVEHRLKHLRFRGAKGTTGTQASFLQLFGGDHEKVRRLDRLVAIKMGFDEVFPVTGQTYSRKVDAQIVAALAGIAHSAHKAATDLRLLQSRRELEEPFEQEQVGSSAMPYKRNPMRAERVCGLARFLMSLETGVGQTAAVQWLERTLDDSALRRLALPQAFLAADAILVLMQNIAGGLTVYPEVIRRHLDDELPFMATETILMSAVERGGDRQELHERIRRHSLAAAAILKEQGVPNDLLQRLQADPALAGVDFQTLLDPARFVGRAPQQVDEFVNEVVEPIRAKYREALSIGAKVEV